MKQRKTTTEVNPKGYGGKTFAIYKGKEYQVVSVNFDEDLIAIDELGDGGIDWKRCESFDKVFNKCVHNWITEGKGYVYECCSKCGELKMEKLKWQIHAESSLTQILLSLIIAKMFIDTTWIFVLFVGIIIGNIYTFFKTIYKLGKLYKDYLK